MKYDAAHQSGWKTAHSIFGLVLLLGIALQILWPLSLQAYIGFEHSKYVGAPFMVLGALVILWSKRELEMHDQPSEPKATTTIIVQSGMFRFSRNPLYLGLLIAFCGLAFATDKLWWLILAPLAAALTHYLLIAPEETYLENKFGDEYLQYKRKVRRWI